MKRSEILANRKAVVEFLQQPERQKALYRLDRGNGKRCCLGHMCHVLQLPEEADLNPVSEGCINYCGATAYAPPELMTKVGLYSEEGKTGAFSIIENTAYSLAQLNDGFDWSPQRIGIYLESVIEGGMNTPWKPLEDYSE